MNGAQIRGCRTREWLNQRGPRASGRKSQPLPLLLPVQEFEQQLNRIAGLLHFFSPLRVVVERCELKLAELQVFCEGFDRDVASDRVQRVHSTVLR
jgi:hypothetical protein